MIHSIMRIGKWAQKGGDAGDVCARFVENPNAKGNIHKVIKIVFKSDNGSIRYQEVGLEDFREAYVGKYLYRFGSHRGADVTPTSKFAGDIEKTYTQKIRRNLQGLVESAGRIGFSDEEKQLIDDIQKELSSRDAEVLDRLRFRVDELEKKEGAIVTLVFDSEGDNRYIGDMEVFRKALLFKARESYFRQYGKKSLGKDKFCSVCRTRREEVYGFANTFTFYTADMRNFVAGGFDQAAAWKNYPVCFDCALNLETGKHYLFRRMRFSFYGFSYLLVPKFNGAGLMDDVFEIMEDISDQKAGQMVKAGFEKSFVDLLTDAEEEIFGLIGEKDDYVGFDLLFFQENKAAFNILLHVEDVLPSRLRTFFEAKARLDDIGIFKEKKDKKGRRELVFNFGVLRRIFPYVSKTQTYDRHFLEITGKIFALKPVDCPFLIKAIMRKVRTKFARDERLYLDLLGGYLLLNFFGRNQHTQQRGRDHECGTHRGIGGRFRRQERLGDRQGAAVLRCAPGLFRPSGQEGLLSDGRAVAEADEHAVYDEQVHAVSKKTSFASPDRAPGQENRVRGPEQAGAVRQKLLSRAGGPDRAIHGGSRGNMEVLQRRHRLLFHHGHEPCQPFQKRQGGRGK